MSDIKVGDIVENAASPIWNLSKRQNIVTSVYKVINKHSSLPIPTKTRVAKKGPYALVNEPVTDERLQKAIPIAMITLI